MEETLWARAVRAVYQAHYWARP